MHFSVHNIIERGLLPCIKCLVEFILSWRPQIEWLTTMCLCAHALNFICLVDVLSVTFNKHLGLPDRSLPSHSEVHKGVLPFPCTVVISSTPRLSSPWCQDYIIRYALPGGRGQWLNLWWHWRFHAGANPKRSKWNKQDMTSEWVICVGTGVKEVIVSGWWGEKFLFFFVMSPPSSAYMPSLPPFKMKIIYFSTICMATVADVEDGTFLISPNSGWYMTTVSLWLLSSISVKRGENICDIWSTAKSSADGPAATQCSLMLNMSC